MAGVGASFEQQATFKWLYRTGGANATSLRALALSVDLTMTPSLGSEQNER